MSSQPRGHQATPVSGRTLRGAGVGAGHAVGPVLRLSESSPRAHGPPAAGRPEADRATTALRQVAAELRERGRLAGQPARHILDAQAMIAEDSSLAAGVRAAVDAGANAEQAVTEAFEHYRRLLAGAGPHLASRIADLDDVRDRALAACAGRALPEAPESDHPYVLVARDVAPAQAALLDPKRILAIVTAEGGPTSHTAILARAHGIPAVVGCPDARELRDGDEVAVDAASGTVTVFPSRRLVAELAARDRAPGPASPGAEATDRPRPARLPVTLLANVGSPAEAVAAAAAGAQGVGLLRTEFLFQDRTRPPSVADQSAAYRAVLDAFAGVPGAHVVARVLDVGADKPLPFLPLGGEPNPALGMRGLRALRAHEHLLDDQLAALAAAADGAPAELWVMAPMVTDAEDAGYFADRAAAFGLRPAGVMIEVPSAALTADAVLARCAFASIGTNDLTQYTLAADRTLGALASRQNPAHPAVLALVAAVAAAGARAGKPVGVCGEAAADPDLAAILVGLGVSSLSMSAGALAGVRARLAVTSEQECRRLAEAALARD